MDATNRPPGNLTPFWHLLHIVMFWCVLPISPANAHSLDQSYVYLNLNSTPASGRVEITVADLNRALNVNLPTDQSVVPADIDVLTPQILDYLQPRLDIHPPDRGNTVVLLDTELKTIENLAQYVLVHFEMTDIVGTRGLPQSLDVNYRVLFDTHPEHRAMLMIEDDWQSATYQNEGRVSLVFDPNNTQQRVDLTGSNMMSGIWGMVKMGVHHIWIGLDHILFLIALLLPAVLKREGDSWRPVESFKPALIYVIKVVTLFTIAHTITLSAATLYDIPVSPRIVESIIALSVGAAALNVFYPVFGGRIWSIIFVFGLFHGLGFASVLSDLGIPPEYRGYSLLAFNVGVELGQLAIVCVVFPFLYIIRESWFYNSVMLRAGSTALILVSVYWVVERGLLINLPVDENFWWALQKYGIYSG